MIAFLRNKARSFMFSTALAPATIHAAATAIDVLTENPQLVQKLRENARYLRNGLKTLKFNVPDGETPIIPVIIGDNKKTMQMAAALENRGIIVSGIRPPTVESGSSRIRATVMATHTRENLDTALEAFEKVGKLLAIIC